MLTRKKNSEYYYYYYFVSTDPRLLMRYRLQLNAMKNFFGRNIVLRRIFYFFFGRYDSISPDRTLEYLRRPNMYN